MRRVLLARFGEVYLKGNNRPYFLRTLVDNVRKAVEDIGGHVWMAESRIYVANATDMDECAERVRKVFGIYSVSPAIEMEKDLDAICRQAAEMMKGMRGSFKVLCKRSDKKFPLNSQELAAKVGESILGVNDKLVVDVHNPEIKMKIDIRRAMLLLSGGIDSPVAGYQIMRRGVHVQSVHFASPPYTSERAREKVLTLAKKIGEYEYGMRVHMVPFTKIQMEIHEKCEDGLGTVIMRRAMMRIADRLAHENNCLGLITGESIGQVASQTMEALACTDAVATMPVFRPLIGMDKLSIIRIAEGIDTYETSILPYEDCCTVFTPRHPVTKPKIDKVEKEEARLDLENLIEEAIQNTEILFLKD